MHATYKGASRVAAVNLVFWVIKILSTGLGETGADYLDHKYDPVIVVILSGIVLAFSLIWQLRSHQYSAIRYWTAVIMVSVFGTLAADAVHVILGVPYWASTAFFAVTLGAVFLLWRRLEGSLEMSSITSTRAEIIYWTAVMTTFALGTAAGDWMAMGLGFGFLGGTLVFTVCFVAPMVLGKARLLQGTMAFWLAYTFTRPMGASFADWLALPPERGGLGLGTLNVTLFWLAAVVLVGVLARRSKSVMV